MKRKQKFILIGGIILVPLLLIYFGIIEPPFGVINFISKKNCEQKGGKFDYYGFSNESHGFCNFPTSDVGKECLSSNECEGYCSTELPDEYFESWRNLVYKDFYGVGKCSEWKLNASCGLPRVENGKIEFPLCGN